MGAQARTFTIDGVVLKKVDNFKHLGCQISSRDSDALTLFMNLANSRKRLSRISNLIIRDGSDASIGGKIYVAAVLAVLLYGLKILVRTYSMLNTIYGFYQCDQKYLQIKNGLI